jgi:hypothetical protein
MLKITNFQGHLNQNKKIQSHPTKTGYYQKIKDGRCWQGYGKNGNPCVLL